MRDIININKSCTNNWNLSLWSMPWLLASQKQSEHEVWKILLDYFPSNHSMVNVPWRRFTFHHFIAVQMQAEMAIPSVFLAFLLWAQGCINNPKGSFKLIRRHSPPNAGFSRSGGPTCALRELSTDVPISRYWPRVPCCLCGWTVMQPSNGPWCSSSNPTRCQPLQVGSSLCMIVTISKGMFGRTDFSSNPQREYFIVFLYISIQINPAESIKFI